MLSSPSQAGELRRADGAPPVLDGTLIDNSGPQRVTALRAGEARLQALLSSLDDLVFELDENGTYLGIWTGNDTLLAKPRSELLGRTVREILTEEIGLRLLQIIGLVLETGRPETWEYRLEVPAGLRWFQIRLAPIAAEGTSRRVCLLVRDITDQKDAEQEISRLLSREQLLTRLSEALPIGLFEIDMAGLVRFTNDRMRPIVGDLPAATLEGLRSSVIAEDRPVLEAALATAYGGHPIDDVEVRLCLRAPGTPMTSGSTRAFSLSLRPLGDPVGVITGVVGCLSDVTERVQLRRELEVMASVDKLTSCLNREASLKLLERITGMPHAHGKGNAVIFIDLDHFKSVNDRFGHAAGDRLLTETADRLRGAARKGDTVGRVGGDEFIVTCPCVHSSDQAIRVAERVAAATTATVDVGSAVVELRTSVGVAWTTEALDADAFIARADSAMYESKRMSRKVVTLFATGSDARQSCGL
ncbi:MAG: diguanylate cyclase [Acidimicrobiales bacterium]